MYLSVLDDVKLHFHGKPTDILNHIKEDYGYFETDGSKVDEVDISVEFVQEESSKNQSVHIRDPIAYDERGVFFHPSGSWSVLRIDFEAVGVGTCKVTCDVNFNRYLMGKLIEHLIHFYLLKREAAICHCSAFKYRGEVIVCPAWRNVGKTNLLLSLLNRGAQYIADDILVIRSDGSIHSLPKRLNLLHYNFKEHPQLLAETSQEFQGLWEFVQRARSGEFGLSDEEIETLTSQARMRVSPFQSFNQTPDTAPQPIDRFCLLQKVANEAYPVSRSPIGKDELAHRMLETMWFEMSYLLLGYQTHKAQLGQVNPYMENAKQKHLKIYKGSVDAVEGLYKLHVPSQNRVKELENEIDAIIDD